MTTTTKVVSMYLLKIKSVRHQSSFKAHLDNNDGVCVLHCVSHCEREACNEILVTICVRLHNINIRMSDCWVLAAVTLREFGPKFLTLLVSGCLWQTCFSVRSWEHQIRLMTKDFTTSFLTIQANFQL